MPLVTALKAVGDDVAVWHGCSDELVDSPISGSLVRERYLERLKAGLEVFPDAPPPVISSSEFVPRSMIEHLLRNKKDSALGVKYLRGDAITNMEGALHTYVTPLALIRMHGDYVYRRMHGIQTLGPGKARTAILSAMIHPDFENDEVMLTAAALNSAPCEGRPLPDDFVIPSPEQKADDAFRSEYDGQLRAHIVAHLLSDRRLPSLEEAKDRLSMSEYARPNALTVLEDALTSGTPPLDAVRGRFARLMTGSVISIELLFQSAVQQLRNELSALERLCPQGYVYTFDPPSIFARYASAGLLNRLFIAALAHIAAHNPLANMRVFAFNDYADRSAVVLIQGALRSWPHIVVMPKSALFPTPASVYEPPEEAEGALLVVHNNSDAFGQNIETEWSSGSMDGAIGCHSSAAAAINRQHPQLLSTLI